MLKIKKKKGMKKKSCETGVHQLTLFLFFSVKGISNLPFLIINMFISQFVFNDSSYHVSLHISLIDFFFPPCITVNGYLLQCFITNVIFCRHSRSDALPRLLAMPY